MSPLFLRHRYEIDPLMEPTSTGDKSIQRPAKITAKNYIQRLKYTQDFAKAVGASAQQRNKFNGNRWRRQPEIFSVGDKVWLDFRNIMTPVTARLVIDLLFVFGFSIHE